MTIDLSNPDTDLVSLLEIEIGHRIDGDAWISVGGDYYFYIADSTNDRIKKHLTTDLTYDSKFGSSGAGNDEFSNPRGVCSDGTYLYICDSINHRIKKHLILDFSFICEIGTNGNGDDQFNIPAGICTDGTYLYICDSDNHRIKKHLCIDLSYDSKLGTQGAGDDQFEKPYGICSDGTYLYIADSNNHRIKKHLCADLSYDSKFGSGGNGDNQFSAPQAICTDDTHLYIADTSNHRIKKHLCLDLTYVSKFGSVGAGNDQFADPRGICTDDTHLYIVDSGNHRIKKHLCADLTYVSKFGSVGAGDDEFNVPWGGSYSAEGYPNLWYISHTEGKPTKVEQCLRNNLAITTYTERATLALCNDNHSSWYWDSVNNRLYLHTSGSDAPDTAGKYLIQSYFWDCFCNKQAGDIVFETIVGIPHFYLPYLDDTIPSIRMETSGYHEGGTKQTFGKISVINADGYFDSRLSDYIYEAKKIRYKVGERGDVYGDYITFWIGWTANIGWSDEYIDVGIDDLRKRREY